MYLITHFNYLYFNYATTLLLTYVRKHKTMRQSVLTNDCSSCDQAINTIITIKHTADLTGSSVRQSPTGKNYNNKTDKPATN